MKIINDLHQLIRDNYYKIAQMEEKFGRIRIMPQPQYYREDNIIKWITIYYKDIDNKITVYLKHPGKDEFQSLIPFNEQLWTDFYKELKEVLNEN